MAPQRAMDTRSALADVARSVIAAIDRSSDIDGQTVGPRARGPRVVPLDPRPGRGCRRAFALRRRVRHRGRVARRAASVTPVLGS